jgi:hypothetical protein
VSKQYSSGLAVATGLCATMLVLAACNQQPATNTAAAPASSASAAAQPQAPAYTPPTADQLYQMVAPIALFPDKLVAQVLAGSTYPDQITAAQNLLTQNPNLKGDLLQAAVEPQSWDASVKGLTQFPAVLSQMAQNIPWTTALGEAYVNDPTDVLNAIQVMRQRASAQGNLRSSAQQQVSTQPAQQVVQSEDASGYAADGSAPPVYSGPDVVPPPTQIIQIEPAQPDAVYVPSYDPQTVYGGEVPYYPSYQYQQPSYSTGEVVAVGAVAFGAAIVVGALLDNHHGGGWHSWGMNWGGGGGGGYNGGGRYHPAVVYNNQTYVSRSTTVINRYTNVTNNSVTNNRYVNNSQNTSNVTNNVNNSRNQFNRNVTNNVTNNNQRPAQPVTAPNFARAGYPSAAPHAAPEARPAAAAAQAQHPNVVHQQPNQAAPTHPTFAPRPQQEVTHQPAPAARPAPHPQPQAAPRQQERPQPAFHPVPQARPQPAPRPTPQQAHPQPQPAFHPAPQAQPAPRPAPPQPRPQPQPPHPQPQAHPAPQQQNNAHQPPKKKDDQGHN